MWDDRSVEYGRKWTNSLGYREVTKPSVKGESSYNIYGATHNPLKLVFESTFLLNQCHSQLQK